MASKDKLNNTNKKWVGKKNFGPCYGGVAKFGRLIQLRDKSALEKRIWAVLLLGEEEEEERVVSC